MRSLCRHSGLTRLLLLAALLAGAGAVRADVVVLHTGERFGGDLLKVRGGGAMSFKTTLSGRMMVLMEDVADLSTERNYVLTLRDGSTLYGRFIVAEEGAAFEDLQGKRRPLALAEVDEALLLPAAPSQDEEGWSGAVSVGALGRSGTEDSVAPAARLELQGQGERVDTEISVLLADNSDGAFPGMVDAEVGIAGTPETGVYPVGRIEVERDENEALALRTGLTLGLGHRFREDDAQSLTADAGLNLTYKAYRASLLSREPRGIGADTRDDETELNAQLGLRYSRRLFGRGALEVEGRLYPSLTDPGELRAYVDAVVRHPVTDRLQLRLDLLMRYDTDLPFPGMDRMSVGFGAGVEFEF